MLVETAALSGAILLILGCASAMAWGLTQSGFAFQLTAMITDLPGGWMTYMVVSILIFMILGCVLEGLPAIVPARADHVPDSPYPRHQRHPLSMVVVVAMNIGLMAPPIGIGFYIACKIGNVSPDEAMAAIWPYLAAMVVGLLLIAAPFRGCRPFSFETAAGPPAVSMKPLLLFWEEKALISTDVLFSPVPDPPFWRRPSCHAPVRRSITTNMPTTCPPRIR